MKKLIAFGLVLCLSQTSNAMLSCLAAQQARLHLRNQVLKQQAQIPQRNLSRKTLIRISHNKISKKTIQTSQKKILLKLKMATAIIGIAAATPGAVLTVILLGELFVAIPLEVLANMFKSKNKF